MTFLERSGPSLLAAVSELVTNTDSVWRSVLWIARLSFVLLFGVPPAQALGQQVHTFELDTLLVTGASRLPGGAAGRVVSIVDREALLRQPVGSVSEAVGWVMGADLQVRSPAQADLSLRGASYEGVLVLVDGVRMSDPQTGHFDLDTTVPLERVERIEVLLGPASAQFGADAVGGVVNIVTRKEWAGGEIRMEGGAFGRLTLAGSGGADLGGWDVTAGAESTESDGHREGTDYEVMLFDGRAGGPLGEGRLEFSLGHGRRNFGAADFYGPFPAYERTRTSFGAVRWMGPAGPLDLTTQVSTRRHTDDFILRRDDPDFYRNNHVSDQVGADVTARIDLGEGRLLAFGSEWIREMLESNALGEREQDRLAAFAEITTPLGPVLATTGMRVDRREGFETFLSPSVSVSVPAGEQVRLRAQAGRAFRTPSWTERYYEDPANIVQGEKSWSVEGGVDVVLPASAVVRATAFRRKSDDLIDWARDADDDEAPWRTRNVESATFRGLELSGTMGSMQTVLLTGHASWLDVETSEAPGLASKSTLRPLTRTLSLAVQRAFLADRGYVRLQARDRTRVGEDGVFLLDVRVGVTLAVGELYLGATNLTDATYADLSGQPAEGRAVSLGLRTLFGS